MKDLGNSIGVVYTTAPLPLYQYIKAMVDRCNQELPPEEHVGKNLSNEFGGKFLLVEDIADLKKIYTSAESELPVAEQDPDCGGWASIVEAPNSFDMCEWILDGGYVAVLLCSNNAGGTTFFVPEEIANNCPNLLASIDETRAAWG
jgi:hypothetical protein